MRKPPWYIVQRRNRLLPFCLPFNQQTMNEKYVLPLAHGAQVGASAVHQIHAFEKKQFHKTHIPLIPNPLSIASTQNAWERVKRTDIRTDVSWDCPIFTYPGFECGSCRKRPFCSCACEWHDKNAALAGLPWIQAQTPSASGQSRQETRGKNLSGTLDSHLPPVLQSSKLKQNTCEEWSSTWCKCIGPPLMKRWLFCFLHLH